ncbi:MAG: sulfotransferase [Bacillota bacterium]
MSHPNPLSQAPAGLEQARADFEAGNLVAAAAEAARLLDNHPRDYAVLYFAAQVAVRERRFPEAEQLLTRAIAASTDASSRGRAWNGLGHLGKMVRNLDSAEESFRRAMLADAGNVEYVLDFADLLSQRGKLEVAIDLLRSAVLRHPRDPQPCLTLGNVLLHANRHRDALAFYDMALQRDPNLAAAHFNAGVALTMLGELDAAKTACETALKLDPELPGYYQLACLGALHSGDAAVPRLEELLQKPDALMERRIDAGFALSRMYDDAGDAPRAFPPLRHANDLKRSTINYDLDTDRQLFERIAAFFTADFFARFQPLSDSKLAPIFVLGMPRSGTTLVEQMLAGHSQVQSGGELNYMPEIAAQLGETWGARGAASPGSVDQVTADLRGAADNYARRTALLHAKRPRFTDKLPGNFMFIGLIHLMFPNARIIHCRRDAADTCFSCYQRLFSSDVPYSYDLVELGGYYGLYQRLMDHWHAVLPAGRILEVDYESVVADPEANVRRMLEFCSLEFEPACLNFKDVKRAVTTASAVQVRKPLYATAVHRWKKYSTELGLLLSALGRDPAGT